MYPLALSILASMLTLATPGQSLYSRALVPAGSPRPCAALYDPHCAGPRLSLAHGGWTVVEPYETGLRRWALIAQTLAEVVQAGTWQTPQEELIKLGLVAMFNESGFREDVHSGIGEAARGDCHWAAGKDGKRHRLIHTCASHCLYQIHLGGRQRSPDGWRGSELVGTSPEATKRCVLTGTRHLERAYQSCAQYGTPGPVCIWSTYGGGIRDAAKDKRVLARVATGWKLRKPAPALSEQDLATLGL